MLFGYTEDNRKCEIRMSGFDICCDLVVDYDFFDTNQAFTKTINDLNDNIDKKPKTESNKLICITCVSGPRVFKGYNMTDPVIYRVSFQTFTRYE